VYSLKVESNFSSAHNLREYKGKCESLHGHNWKIEAVAESATLDKTGMVMDFKLIKSELNKILEKLDHKYLNKIKPFDKTNPTSENIARFIFEALKKKIAGLKSITVWENPTSSATYYEQ
jgi:6-pyruvoyltetrahydropterin/6-carboxytetrahydropterin synthase